MNLDQKSFEKQMKGAAQYATALYWIGCLLMWCSVAIIIIAIIRNATGHAESAEQFNILTRLEILYFLGGAAMVCAAFVIRTLRWIAMFCANTPASTE